MIPRWLPNLLSATRLAMVPAWAALAWHERARALEGADPKTFAVITVMFFIGATDFVDGQLARRFHLESNLGATLDAVADKLATFAAVTFLAFFAWPLFTPLPVWLWAGLLLRDLVLGVGYGIIFSRHRAVAVEHRWHGRASTALLFLTVVAAVFNAPVAFVSAASALVLLLVVPGTWDYMREGWRQLHLHESH